MNTLKHFLALALIAVANLSQAQQDMIAKNDLPAGHGTYAVAPAADRPFTLAPVIVVRPETTITVVSDRDDWAMLKVVAGNGNKMMEQQMAVSKGTNTIPVFFASGLKKGTYQLVLRVGDRTYRSKLIKE